MRPTPLRLLLVAAAAATLLAVAASGVFAASDLSACTLVASEGTHPNPVGTILEGVDAVDGQAWAVGGHVVGPVSSPFIQRWNGTSWAEQKAQVPPGPIGISSFYAVKAFPRRTCGRSDRGWATIRSSITGTAIDGRW